LFAWRNLSERWNSVSANDRDPGGLCGRVLGSQPNASATPIFITEFNTFTNGQGDCCANSATYAPIWNGLVVSELLRAVSKGAKRAVSGLYYYAAAAPWSKQCLVGQIDPAMDCAWNSDQLVQGYPQYHAFELIFAPEFLDLTEGGFIASSQQNGVEGIAAAAFYTASSDSVMLVNTSGTELRRVPIRLYRVGLGANKRISMFLLNSATTAILRQVLSATQEDGGYTLQLDIPPYSLIGLSVRRSQ
jgi:hypothetical protein